MTRGRIPSGPHELRRWVEMTEARPEEAHGWHLLAEELARAPGRRQWVEDIMRELFLERVLGARGSVAVICNIARRLRLTGLALLFARYLEEPLESWSDAEVRSLMGAILELSAEHADIECVMRHGARADVFAVAVHLIAVIDGARAVEFVRARLEPSVSAARHPERIWDSLAKLFLGQVEHRRALTTALAELGEEHAYHFLQALAQRVARDTDRTVGPHIDALQAELERLAAAYRARTDAGGADGP